MLSSPTDINAKITWLLPRTVGLVCLCVGGSRRYLPRPRYRLQYLVSVSVLAGGDGAVVTNAFHFYNACWYMRAYMRALNNNGNTQRR